jgi:hypothetical protein
MIDKPTIGITSTLTYGTLDGNKIIIDPYEIVVDEKVISIAKELGVNPGPGSRRYGGEVGRYMPNGDYISIGHLMSVPRAIYAISTIEKCAPIWKLMGGDL